MAHGAPDQAAQALVERWRALNREHTRVLEALDRALQGAHGVSSCELDVLQRLAAGDERMRLQDLCDCVQRSQSALSRMVGRLEDEGLVARLVCPNDRRGVNVGLTDPGRELLEAATATQQRVLADTL